MNDEIARLEKEVSDLQGRAREIGLRLTDRRRELDAAKADKLADEYAALGIVPGCKVVATRWRLGQEIRTTVGFMGVENDRWSGAHAVLTKIKKDGTPGRQSAGIHSYDRLELAPDQ